MIEFDWCTLRFSAYTGFGSLRISAYFNNKLLRISAFLSFTSDDGLIPFKEVEDKIVMVRGQEVLLDRDVASLYGVETREVNQAVRNNPRKFRKGYMFELTSEESSALRSNLLTLECHAEPLDGGGEAQKIQKLQHRDLVDLGSLREKTCRVDVFRVSEFRVGARYLPFSCHQS